MKKIVLTLLYTLILRHFLQVIMGVHYNNRAALDEADQFILVANHNSHLDTVALMSALTPQQVALTKPVAAGDYFGKTGLKKWLTQFFVNALLIPRSRPKEGENTPDPIQLMINELDKKNSLILFPEGTRGEADKMQKFKKGIGLVLSQRPDIPFIAAHLKGMGKLLPKGESIPVPFDNYVRFGNPVYTHGLSVEEIVALVEKEILDLAVLQEG